MPAPCWWCKSSHVIGATRLRAPRPLTGAIHNFSATAAVLLAAGSLSTSHMLGQLTIRAVSMSETHNTRTTSRPCICINRKNFLLPVQRSTLSALPLQALMSVCLWCLPSLLYNDYKWL